MWRILFSDASSKLGPNGFDPAGKLLDAALRRVELGRADGVQLLAAFPERDRLVEARLPALEPLDDRLQLALGVLEAELAQCVSSTVASKPPVPSSTSTRVPAVTSEPARTIELAVRTIA